MLVDLHGRHSFVPPARFGSAVGCPAPPSGWRAVIAVFFIGNFLIILRYCRLRSVTWLTIPRRCRPAGGRQNSCTQSPPTVSPLTQEDWGWFPPALAASSEQRPRCRSGEPPTCRPRTGQLRPSEARPPSGLRRR